MRQENPECPECGRAMEPGYMLDHTHGGILPAAWVPGPRKWHWWSGLGIRKKDKVPVTTYRCPRCARLQSYAYPGPWPPKAS